MRRSEKGFTVIELVIACTIAAVLGSVGTMSVFQTMRSVGASESHLVTVNQLRSAGDRIGRDAQTAEDITTDGLQYPNFLVLTWIEQDFDGGDPIYHAVTYFFDDLIGGIGVLKRNHSSSAGTDDDFIVGMSLYYDPNDPGNTSNASYQDPMLTVTLRAIFGDTTETRTYEFARRLDFTP